MLPSVLIRVPFDQIGLLDRGQIQITSGQDTLAHVSTRKNQGSVMIGPSRGVPSTFMDKWMMELLALGVRGEPLYSCLLYWQRSVMADSSVPLVPGMELEAIFFVDEKKPLARSRFWMGNDRVQDVMLLKEE